MKKLTLENSSFRYVEKSFAEWLEVLGYAPTTVYYMPLHVRELLSYLEQKGINHIKDLDIPHIEAHYNHLKERANDRRGGGLSNAHLNKHIQALRKFTEYLRKVGRLQLPALKLGNEEASQKLIYLTEEEITALFEAAGRTESKSRLTGKPNFSIQQLEAIRSRDKAMLAVFYGCGLRRNEGVNLDVGDINFDRSLLHVRKGKNYKERMVPINKASRKYLLEYIYDHRSVLLRGSKTDALFISYNHSRRMQGQSLNIRLKVLQFYTGNIELQQKEIGLHTLRHSIATHLLQAGMKMESISRFLGHTSLESTQVYTHLDPNGIKQQPFNNTPRYEIEQLHEDER